MLAATLHSLFKFALIIGAIVGLIFMIVCTALVIVSFICGDIRINTIESETKK